MIAAPPITDSGIAAIIPPNFGNNPIRTKQVNKSENSEIDGEIIHKGISQRQFARSFTIADDVKVNSAELKDGLLTISCERIIPEHKKKKLIEIK